MDNLHAFAGVVSKGGRCGKTGPQILDIYIPNGAIVPVDTVLTATVVGRTILAINSGTITFGNPTEDIPSYGSTAGNIDGRSVAIAEETIAAAGLVLARLDENIFVHQGGQVDNELIVGYVGTVDTAVNRMFLKFDQTAGHCQALHYRAKLTGNGTVHASRGVYRFETFVNISGTGGTTVSTYGVDTLLDIGAGSTTGYLAPLKATLRTRSANPDLSGSHAICCLVLEYIMTKTTTTALDNPPPFGSLIYVNSDSTGTEPVYFLHAERYGCVAITADTVAADDAAAKSMLIHVNGIDMHIPCYTDAEIA